MNHLAIEIGKLASIWRLEPFTLVDAELAESFPLWVLPADMIVADLNPGQLAEFARETGRWHHQIVFDGAPLVFARSAPIDENHDISDPASWIIVELFESPLAAALGAAVELDWVQDASVVRLLAVPAYQVHALWVGEGAGRLVIVECPTSYQSMSVGQTMSEQQFMRALLAESPIDCIR